MRKTVVFVTWLVAVLAGGTTFNLVIGVFGLDMAVATLVVFTIFSIYTSFRPQPEEKEPHA